MGRKQQPKKIIREDIVDKISNKLLDSLDEICKEIDEEFKQREMSLNHYISYYIGSQYGMNVEEIQNLIWEYDDCPYDFSGVVKQDGMLSHDITLEDFFEKHTGNWTATYNSGYGKHWETFLDDISYESLNVGEDIMWSILYPKMYEICSDLTEDEIWVIRDDIHDDFYDNTKTFYYFNGFDLSEDILNMQYNDFVKLANEEKNILEKEGIKDIEYKDFYERFYK